jgi:hypothetical protein
MQMIHNILGRMKEAMKQTYEELKRAAKEMGLFFNVKKIYIHIYIYIQSRCDTHTGKEVKTGDMIEVADKFVYLGTCSTKHRDEMEDIKRRIGLANDTYHSLLPLMKSRGVLR